MNSKIILRSFTVCALVTIITVLSVHIYSSMQVLDTYSKIDISEVNDLGSKKFTAYIKESKNISGTVERALYSTKQPLFWGITLNTFWLVFLPMLFAVTILSFWNRKHV